MVSSESLFQCSTAPPDPILNLSVSYRADTDPRKVDLGVGAYRDENGRPFIFKSVRKAAEAIHNDPEDNHEYTTIDGHPKLKMCTLKVLFGEALAEEHCSRIVSSQALSGTGALRLASEFIATHFNRPTVYVSDPTWSNHYSIFAKANLPVKTYPYWDAVERKLNMEGLLSSLESAESGSVVLLHACAHNPTGCDPTPDEFKKIVQVILARNLIALADTAYQGYASGDLEKDSFLVRELLVQGAEFFVTQSFAKNLGLYGERFGMIHIVTANAQVAAPVLSQLKLIIRPMYSSPPVYGAKLALRVLSDSALYEEWLTELVQVSRRLRSMRIALADRLEGDWSHIKTQIGMFSFTGLTPTQVDRMTSVWHVYMLRNGRISLAGLNSGNIDYVVQAINDCVKW